MKNINYKDIKRHSNNTGSRSTMPRFDIGKRVNVYSGYQAGELLDTSQFLSTPAQSFADYASLMHDLATATAITGGLDLAGNIGKLVMMNPLVAQKLGLIGASTATNAATNAATLATSTATNAATNAVTNTATNVGQLATAGLFTNPGATNALNLIVTGTTTNVVDTAGNVAANTAGAAAETAGNVAGNATEAAGNAGSAAGGTTGLASNALKVLGPLASISGMVTGGLGMANALQSFNNPVVSSSAALNSMGTSTQTKYGQAYTTYTGLDKGNIRDLVEGANKRDKTSLTMNTASTGASTGALIGLAGGPVGSLIGMALGGLFGLFGGLFGGESLAEKRRKRTERMMANLSNVTSNYNTNAESEAASAGLRRMFNESHYAADKGKDTHTNGGLPGKIKYVHTSNGIQPGIELGIAGGKESVTNFRDMTSSVINEGTKRVDNISVGVPLGTQNPKQDWDDNVFIAGNVINPETGNTIALDAEPHAKNVEKINKENPMGKISKMTKEINLRNEMEQLRHLSDILTMVHNAQQYYANYGKLPRHVNGKLIFNYASAILPHLASLGMLYSDNTDYTPRSYNPYVASNYEPYINSMKRRKLDPTQAVKNTEKAGLQNRYAITHQGGLSGGQIAAISALSNLAVANAKNNILADYAQKNVALENEADRLGMQAAMSEAARKQQGNAYHWDNYARSASKAYDAKQALNEAKRNELSMLSKDFLSMLQYNDAIGLKQGLIDKYDQRLTDGQNKIVGSLGKPKVKNTSRIKNRGIIIDPNMYNITPSSILPDILFI